MTNFEAYKKSLTDESFHEMLLHLPQYCFDFCPAWQSCVGWKSDGENAHFIKFCCEQFKEWANTEYSEVK